MSMAPFEETVIMLWFGLTPLATTLLRSLKQREPRSTRSNMTIQNKKTKQTELEAVDLSKGTITFRTALMLMIFAATPPGQQVLKNFGLTAPPTEGVNQMHRDIETVRQDVGEVKKDLSAVNDKMTKMEANQTRFQVDFDRFRSEKTKVVEP